MVVDRLKVDRLKAEGGMVDSRWWMGDGKARNAERLAAKTLKRHKNGEKRGNAESREQSGVGGRWSGVGDIQP